jgi:hypothetical protein
MIKCDATCPRWHGRSRQDLLSHGPKSCNTLQIPYRDFSSPTELSVDLPAVASGNRVSRYREPYAHSSCNSKLRTPNADGQRSTDRDIATRDVNSMPFPKPRAPRCRFSIKRHLDSPIFRAPLCHVTSGFRGSRILDTKFPCCWKPRTPKPRFSGFVPPVLPTIDGSHEIGKSLFAISTCMQLLHSPTPICRNAMANEFHLRLEVNSFSRVQVVDSLPLEESFAPNLLPFGLLLGLFHNTCKELSLLSFHQLSTQNHSGFNSSIRSHTQHMKEVRNKKQICKGIMPTTHRK